MPWTGAAAAGIGVGGGLASSALSLLGKRGPSERDLMWEQQRVMEHSAKTLPSAHMAGLKSAGLNPMLAYSQGTPKPSMPSIAAPVDKGTDAGKALQAGLATALEAFRAFADIDVKKEQAKLTAAQTATEAKRPDQVAAQTEEAIASTLNKRQQARLSTFDQELRRIDIDVRQRDLIKAEIEAGLWREANDVIMSALRRLKISETVVPKVLGTIDQLRALDSALQKGGEGLVNSAVDWWRKNFDSSREEKKHWPR